MLLRPWYHGWSHLEMRQICITDDRVCPLGTYKIRKTRYFGTFVAIEWIHQKCTLLYHTYISLSCLSQFFFVKSCNPTNFYKYLRKVQKLKFRPFWKKWQNEVPTKAIKYIQNLDDLEHPRIQHMAWAYVLWNHPQSGHTHSKTHAGYINRQILTKN